MLDIIKRVKINDETRYESSWPAKIDEFSQGIIGKKNDRNRGGVRDLKRQCLSGSGFFSNDVDSLWSHWHQYTRSRMHGSRPRYVTRYIGNIFHR